MSDSEHCDIDLVAEEDIHDTQESVGEDGELGISLSKTADEDEALFDSEHSSDDPEWIEGDDELDTDEEIAVECLGESGSLQLEDSTESPANSPESSQGDVDVE